MKRVYHIFQLMSIPKSAFFRTSNMFFHTYKRYFSYLISYLRRGPYQDKRSTSLGDVGAGGRASANATPATPARLLANRSISHDQIVKHDPVRDMQLTSEDSADRYAAAPAECAPACSAGDNVSSEKEKSHSFELTLAFLPCWFTCWLVQDYFSITGFACQYL